jgi:hypothetical protein
MKYMQHKKFNRELLNRITELENKVESVGNLLGDVCHVLKEIRSKKMIYKP